MTSPMTEQRGTQQSDEQARGNREREEPEAFGAERVLFSMRLYHSQFRTRGKDLTAVHVV